MSVTSPFVQLRAGGVSLVLDVPAGGAPRVLHWGADLGELTEQDVDALRLTGIPGRASGLPEAGIPLTMLPAHAQGWLWTPGVSGHRDGVAFSPAFTGAELQTETTDGDPVIAQRTRVTARDEANGIDLRLDVEIAHSGLVRTRAALTNTVEGAYEVSSLDIALPVPGRAGEIIDMAGRQLRERELQRAPFGIGTHLRESRKSSGHEASLILAAATPGAGWGHGEVWAVHPGWSGNTRVFAERNNMGMSTISGGELLLPGEVRLGQGETYESPWLYASTGAGLDELSGRFHDFLRSRPSHPSSPRPVTLNVWEAVYFDHSLGKLIELADRAAEIGVERYVLDDGWFRHRRDDHAGLGDWYVDEGVWPDGLHPIADAVVARGMQFGLWFEPEMINEDSDLAREHPEWIMGTGDRLPPAQRHQQVLNIAHPDAYAHIRDRILAILDEYPISYIKWDHNRTLTEPGDRATGRPIAHAQTTALYRLFDEIRAAHPGLEIESCASGGGRMDLGIMMHTDRIWGSDCIDPLERQQTIEPGTSLLLPPELVGSHVASPVSHTTGRSHTLAFRAGTALFSHMGVEWDVTTADDAGRAELAQWIALHRTHRELLHTGRVVHGEENAEGLALRGAVAHDGSEAIVSVAALRTSPSWPNPRVTIPGLDPERRYRVSPLAPGDAIDRRTAHSTPAWWGGAVELTGRVLAQVGVQLPSLNPEQLVLFHLTAA